MPRPDAPRWDVARVLIGAIGLGLSFPPMSALGGWLAVPALALVLSGFPGASARRGAALGAAAGLVFFAILLRWIAVLGPDAWIALTLLCTAFWALLGALLPAAMRMRWRWLVVPVLWAGVEALRARVPWGGFPWGRLAFAEPTTALGGWAPIGGAAAVSFMTALAATLVLLAWTAGRRRDWPRAWLAGAGLVLVVVGGILASVPNWGGPVTSTVPIAIVQGNVPRAGLDFNAQRRAVLDNHVRQTIALASDVAAGRVPAPRAVIWPENSSDIDPLANADAAAEISRAAAAIMAPILVGSIVVNPDDPPSDTHPGTVLNVGLVWDPDTGPGQFYVKRHPVPFGEYLPLRGLLSRFITRFDRIPRDFAPGTVPGVLDLGGVPAGVVICFEVAYDALPADVVRAGGQVLVVQTNNATYAMTGQPEQQLAMTILRARETGRTALVAATSGISAVITPSGSMSWSAPEMTGARTVAQVPLRAGLTPAVRLGQALDLSLLLGAATIALVAIVAARASARPVTASADPSSHGTMST